MRGASVALVVALAAACSSACSEGRSASAPPDAGSGGGSGGGDGGGSGPPSYSPQGCQYTFTPPAAFNYLDFALDDEDATTPIDPASGAPLRVRVGLGGGTTKGQPGYADPTTSAAFTWETAAPNRAAKVKLGTSPAALSQVQTGYAWRVHPILGSQDAYFHEAHLCGLTPGTTYFYQVGGGPAGGEVWSATQSFTTMPASGTITLGLFGDARDTKAIWQAVHLRMRAAGVAMSVVGGDVVDIGAEETLYVEWLDAIWKDPADGSKFLTLGQQYILPINGNHENDTSTSFANWAIPGDGPYAKTYASFDVGAAHVTMIDDEHIASAPTSAEAQAQLAWIDADLRAAAADRASHPFLVVVSHRGLYSTSLHATDADVIAARGALAPLFDKYGVNLVVNGHEHEYERTVPIKAGSPATGDPTADPQGTTYVVCAGAGADAYAVGTAPVSWRQTKTAFGPGTSYIGTYALLTIAPAQLTLEAYGMKASSSTVEGDDVIDTVTLSH
jgi:hypothetical protein